MGSGGTAIRDRVRASAATRSEPPVAPPPSKPSRPSLGTTAVVAVLGAVAFAALTLVPEPTTVPEYQPTAAPNRVGPAAGPGWLTWESHPHPADAVLAHTLTATRDAFVVVGGPAPGGAVLWSSPDGIAWEPSELPTIPYGLATAGSSVLAFRGDVGWWLERDGSAWRIGEEIELPTYLRLGYESTRAPVIPDPAAMVVQSVEGELLYGDRESGYEIVIDRETWGRPSEGMWEDFTGPRNPGPCRADTTASNDYVPIVQTDDGLVALVGGGRNGQQHGLWPACSPRLWRSEDGRAWTLLDQVSPFGVAGHVYDLAWHDGLFVAVGGIGPQPVVWSSTDGLEWERIRPPGFVTAGPEFAVIEVEAGPLGWVIVAERADRVGHLGWASPDGRCWLTIPDEAAGRHPVVGTDRILIAGGTDPHQVWTATVTPDQQDAMAEYCGR